MNLLVDIAGWLAAVTILLAYGMLSTGRLSPRSPVYQGLNFVGAAGFILNSGWHGAWPSAVLNVVWLGISCYALWRPPGAVGAR